MTLEELTAEIAAVLEEGDFEIGEVTLRADAVPIRPGASKAELDALFDQMAVAIEIRLVPKSEPDRQGSS